MELEVTGIFNIGEWYDIFCILKGQLGDYVENSSILFYFKIKWNSSKYIRLKAIPEIHLSEDDRQ